MTKNYIILSVARDVFPPCAVSAVRGVVIDGATKLIVDVCEGATITEVVTSLTSDNEVDLIRFPDDSLQGGDELSLAEVAEAVYPDFDRQVRERAPHHFYTSADHYTGLGSSTVTGDPPRVAPSHRPGQT